MMRVVFDTNVVVSGRLWSGSPKAALNAAYHGRAQIVISEALLDELGDVLRRPKLAKRLQLINLSPQEIVEDHLRFTEVVEAVTLPSSIVRNDPDDDHVLACALGGGANCIVTGDPHLLQLGFFQTVPILTVTDFLARLNQDT